MTQEHPITPPPELVRHWSRFQGDTNSEALWFRIANCAAQWGADQELEACIDWMKRMGYWGDDGKAIPALRAARRPSPNPPETIKVDGFTYRLVSLFGQGND